MSESDTDPTITTSLGNDPRRFIPTGRSESQPNIFGLGPCTIGSRHPHLRRLSLGSGAADVLRRVEEMKSESNEWRISAESQLISMKVLNEPAKILPRLSLKLADEAMDSGIDISLCKLIADYEISTTIIKLRITNKLEYQNNLSHPNSYRNGQVLDSYRLESDLLAYDNIGLDNLHCNELELESFRLEWDIYNDPNYEPFRLESNLYNDLDLDNFRLESDIYINIQPGTESSAGQKNTGCYDRYCGGQVLDSYRLESDTLFYSTLLYSKRHIRYSTLLYSTLLYSIILYSPLLYSTLL